MKAKMIISLAVAGTVALSGATAFANMQFGVRVVDCVDGTPLEGVTVHGFIGSQIPGDDELYDYTDGDGYGYLAGANADNVLYCNYDQQLHNCAVKMELEGYETTYWRGPWINTAEAVNVDGTNYDNYYRHYVEEAGHNLDEMTVEMCAVNTILDFDGDGMEDGLDNCPGLANAGQLDGDGDGVGDLCDNCIGTPNFDQLDGDNDGTGNACTQVIETIPDTDGDGFTNEVDNCPSIPNADQGDEDGNGIGDLCDYGFDDEVNTTPTPVDPAAQDSDFDGVPDSTDNCPLMPNASQEDICSGGLPPGEPAPVTPSDDDANPADDDATPVGNGNDDAPAEGGSTSDDGGCSVAPTHTNGGIGGLMLMLIGLAFAARRKA